MTTTIVPSAGAAPLYTQQGVGTTPGYAALDDRRANVGPMQAGVYGTSTLVTAGGVASVANADFMVTQRNAGANMSVDINMPAGGFAWVQGTTINGQGLYCVPVHSANINETIAAADPTNPRVDQVILEIQDNVLDASGGNLARTRVVTGTPNATATLTTRAGAPALPGNCLLLGDVLVPAGSSSVPNTNIRDRRKWARGACVIAKRTAGDITFTSSSFVSMGDSVLIPRIECSGAPLTMKLEGRWQHSTTLGLGALSPIMDGSAISGMSDFYDGHFPTAGGEVPLSAEFTFTPTAGSHTFQWFYRTSGATLTVSASSGTPHILVIKEVLQAGSANNTVTSG